VRDGDPVVATLVQRAVGDDGASRPFGRWRAPPVLASVPALVAPRPRSCRPGRMGRFQGD